jgi:hypothetical protein
MGPRASACAGQSQCGVGDRPPDARGLGGLEPAPGVAGVDCEDAAPALTPTLLSVGGMVLSVGARSCQRHTGGGERLTPPIC